MLTRRMVDFSSFTRVFSRLVLVGLFAPVFIALVVLDVSLHEDTKPTAFKPIGDRQFVYLAFLSLGAALFLGSLRHLFYKAAMAFRIPGWKRITRRDDRSRYRRPIDDMHSRIDEVWGVSYDCSWPVVRSILEPREQYYYDETETSATLYLVSGFMVLLASGVLVVDSFLHRDAGWYRALFIFALPAAYLLYRQACAAAGRLATQVVASYALHYGHVREAIKRLCEEKPRDQDSN